MFLLSDLCSIYGRGYPDISAQAFGCRIYLNSVASIASGTVCAVSVRLSLILARSALRRGISGTQLTPNV